MASQLTSLSLLQMQNAACSEDGFAKLLEEYVDRSADRKVSKYLPEDVKVQQLESDDSKPAKVKGRNKKRPINKNPAYKDRICYAFLRNECTHGDKCRWSHEVDKYKENKPEDIPGKCYNFSTFGYCSYGMMCRFAGNHTDAEKNNITDEVLKAATAYKVAKLNVLPKDTQRKLRKHQYDFEKTEQIMKCILNADSGQSREMSAQSADSDKLTEHAGDKHKIGDVEDTSSEVKLPKLVVESFDHVPKRQLEEDNCPRKSPKLDVVGENASTNNGTLSTVGCVTDEDVIRLRPQEKKVINFTDKLYLAPLTTVGNLPFRRICKQLGADVTCGEMAMPMCLLKGQQSEWALLRRHHSEDIFGVQLCASNPTGMARTTQLLCENIDVDFIDINCGCPIDMVYKRGEGSALIGRPRKLEQLVRGMSAVSTVPLTLKCRTGIVEKKNIAHDFLFKLKEWGISMASLHGRSREQRYTRLADWAYIDKCAKAADPLPLFGNGDIFTYEDYVAAREKTSVAGVLIARGALVKPWLFSEIKEQRHWDISANERLDMVRDFANYGMEHWGSDHQGVETTRRFLLEWLSFTCRYIPLGLLERPPQRINEKPPVYHGRNDLETLLSSNYCDDWIKISEMFLGPVPADFTFLPKHKASSYR